MPAIKKLAKNGTHLCHSFSYLHNIGIMKNLKKGSSYDHVIDGYFIIGDRYNP